MSKKKIDIAPLHKGREYVLWKRVSTGKQGKSGLGLEAQEAIAKMFMGKDPVAIFTDVFSGTKLRQCKGLWEAIEMCKQNNLLLCIPAFDRLRNVQEALEILDAVGESNVVICDVPTADRFVLTVLFAVAERQAIMIRVKTQLALAERKKQIEKDGGFMSKSGHWRRHLGNDKGADVSAATAVQARIKADEARAWRESNDGYRWVKKQVQKGRLQKDILEEFNEFHDMGLAGFSTRNGCKMNVCTLSKWIQEIKRQN